MKDTLSSGLSTTARIEVDTSRTIAFMGDDCRVYGSNWLVFDIEMTSRNFLLEHLDEGEDSVGTHITLDHMAATPMGMWVEVTVNITEVKGRMISIEFECRDELDAIAKGSHNRFIVDVATTADRIRDKQARAS
jgi:fluoroacetyl-CoA thioesterase